MMKRASVVLLAVVVLGVAALRAQSGGWSDAVPGWGSLWCSNCVVVQNVDIPSAGASYPGYFAGFGAECHNGQRATGVDIYYGSTRITDATLYVGLSREDVYAYAHAGGTFASRPPLWAER